MNAIFSLNHSTHTFTEIEPFQYLCDRADPVIPCELVRGYLDYMPHAWNVVLVKSSSDSARMLVDACRPLDIRQEQDSEYFCR